MDIQWLLKQSTDTGATKPAYLALRAGNQLTASVLAVGKGSTALLAIGRFKAFAKIDIPVYQGQTLPLTVVKSDEGIAFSVASPVGSSGSDRLVPTIAAAAAAANGARTGLGTRSNHRTPNPPAASSNPRLAP